MTTPVSIHSSFSRLLFASLLVLLLPLGASVAWAQEAPARSVKSEQAQLQTVNINTASAAALSEVLTGIGPSKAEAIVAYRQQFGPFKQLEELLEVKGIGQATLEKNRSRIRLQ